MLTKVSMVNSMQSFRVIIGHACKNNDDVSVIIDEPNDEYFEQEPQTNDQLSSITPKISLLPILTVTPGGFTVNFQPKLTGTYKISVLLNSINITGSPFVMEVLPLPVLTDFESEDYNENIVDKCPDDFADNRSEENQQPYFQPIEQYQQALQAHAYGTGLGPIGYVNCMGKFTVDLRQVHGELNVTRVKVIVEGPSHAKIFCKNNGDRTCSIGYLPTKLGIYYLSILYNQYHIQDSPYRIEIIAKQQKLSRSTDDLRKMSITNRQKLAQERSKSLNTRIRRWFF